jgi:hypothetical protein
MDAHADSKKTDNTAEDGGDAKNKTKRIAAQPQDVVLASTTLALTLTKGRNRYEIETLINLFSLTTSTLQAILAQILINNRYTEDLEIPL